MWLNKDRDMIITKRIDISHCNFDKDVEDATSWTLNMIESNDFQSGWTCLELLVDTLWRQYTVTLYRDWWYMHVWFDGYFAFEVDLSWWWFTNTVRSLFQNWRRVPWIQMEYHWDRADPMLIFNWMKACYREVENTLREDFTDWLKEADKYNEYNTLSKSVQEKRFDDRLYNNYYKIVETFITLQPHERKSNG